MKMIWCGLKFEENHHGLVNKLHENLRSKTLDCRKIKSVFKDVKWCFNASWGLKGLNDMHDRKLLVSLVENRRKPQGLYIYAGYDIGSDMYYALCIIF